MSPDQSLPPELRAFLHSCFESIDDVELVMVLRGSDRWRTARDVAAEFRLSPSAARQRLETLAARGVLEVRVGEETSYRYRPKSEELGRYCDLLAQVLHFLARRRTGIRGKQFAPLRKKIRRRVQAAGDGVVMGVAVYLLCFLTSTFCAAMLLRQYRRSASRLLFWSSLSFIGWALNNALLFADLVVFPAIDLAVVRTSVALAAISLLVFGLIWDAA